MQRLRTLCVAAVLACALASAPAAVRADDVTGSFTASLVGIYAQLLRHINPQLALTKCISYAQELIDDAIRARIDPRLLVAVVTVESHWKSQAVSYRGATGLGQLMPRTAESLGVNPRSADQNLRGTSEYLHRLLARFGSNPHDLKLVIGAYNAGPNAVIKYKGIPPYHETRVYVNRVLHFVHQLDGKYALDVPIPSYIPAGVVRATWDVPTLEPADLGAIEVSSNSDASF
jgi:soluble lytic murein transglycosylase-like protein